MNWYPGHIEKAKKQMARFLKAVDVVVEVLDARAPAASRAYEHQKLFAQKKRLVVLTKKDLADPGTTSEWKNVISKTFPCIAVSPRTDRPNLFFRVVERFYRPRFGELRLMIAGIPNVGKSTLINWLGRKRVTRVGALPGITRGVQWIRLTPSLLVLDTPGIVYPKVFNRLLAAKLMLIGSIDVDKVDPWELYEELSELLLPVIGSRELSTFLEEFGRSRGLVVRGGEVDKESALKRLIRDFSEGKFGSISLERPQENPIQ
ncbi:MAG: ribosome biosis GTPase [Thermotogota bacterium]|nr:ribosome biosis GTPase [Thermotogota bacterium]MDK2863995.1 ribosome biosis GTPase [Thermotogota bacterium]HCZ06542.1 ribosome biogenesis GTPase YlqF [Thermotogota bacterium]